MKPKAAKQRERAQREQAAAASHTRRNYAIAVIAVVVLVLGYRHFRSDDDPASEPPPADTDGTGTQHRTVGPDLAAQLGKVRAHRTGSIDFDPDAAQGGVVISGTVLDLQSHEPVGNVEVVFRSPLGEETTTAGADGTYKIRIQQGIYRAFVRDDLILSVGRPDRVRLPGTPSADTAGVPDEALMPLVVANGDVAGIDLSVMKGGTVTGKVIDGNGRPIAHAVVSARGNVRPTLGTDIAESDDKGAFELRIPAGSYGIEAVHPRFAGVTDDAGVYVAGGDTANVTITLVAGCVITGKVVLADGKPAADGAMEKQWGTTSTEFGPSGRVEPDGTFRWVTLEEGRIQLRAWPWKSPPTESKQFDCKDGARYADIVFHVPNQTPDIEGTLVDADGQPVPFAFIDLAPLSPGGLGQQERTDAEGHWGVFAMPHGKYRLTAQAVDRGMVSMTVESPQSGVQVKLGGTGRIEGTTTTLVDGSFEMSLLGCFDGDSTVEIAQQRRLVAVHSGHFEIENVPACNLSFAAMYRGRRTMGDAEVPTNGIVHVQVDVGPPKAKTVLGHIVNKGVPVPNVVVTAIAEGSDPVTATTDADGRYKLKTVSEATIIFVVDGREHGAQVGMANVDQEEIFTDIGEEIIDRPYDDDYEEPYEGDDEPQ